jgi:arylsulfatase A-like enzyme
MKRAILAGLVLVCLTLDGAGAADRPNLLFISIDTLRADHVSCYGYSRPTTPTIDEIASNGTRFAAARSVAPWTLPSFASMFTGRFPTRHGAGASGEIRNIAAKMPRPMAADLPTLAGTLRKSGYRTAAITSNPYLKLGPLRDHDEVISKTVRADRIGALARDWVVRTTGRQPWMLWVHFNDPHEPTMASDARLKQLDYGSDVLDDPERKSLERWGSDADYLGDPGLSADEATALLRTKLALYDASILDADTEIGRILETLHRNGELRNTLVVVVSDHGEEFYDHRDEGRIRAEDPRGVYGIGHGHTLYEEQLHVPLIFMGPGARPAKVIEESFSLVDLMPTVLGYLQVAPPDGLDGVDRRSWIVDDERLDTPFAAESIGYGPERKAWSDGRLKLICDPVGTPLGLFDMDYDQLEQVNLVDTLDSMVTGALRQQLLDWQERLLANPPPLLDEALLTDEMREGLRSLGYVE